VPIVPREFLDVAKKVCPATATEAEARTAQGRAYYAAYLTIREKLASLGIRDNGSNPHQWLLQKLRTARNDDIQDIGDRLSAMLVIRHKADYSPTGYTVYPSDGVLSANHGEQLLADFARISNDILQQSIR
jgi:hypothetical protein